MTISVVIPTYRYENLSNLSEAVWSLRRQTQVPEIIVVVGGDIQLYKQAKLLPVDRVILDHDNGGACQARNIGAEEAMGTVVAFLDDDEIARTTWCAELWRTYTSPSLGEVGGVGGRTLPLWECTPPRHLPEEMWWLVGATHKGFTTESGTCQVRNTFAGNISFRKDVFDQIGGFKTDIGFSDGRMIQGEEPEICDRLRDQTYTDFWYNPNAVVYNRVPEDKAKIGYLMKRAYWQGITKRLIQQDGHALTVEQDYLSGVLSGAITRISQTATLCLLTCAVGAGYVKKVIR